jgi:long-chain acyl-CoA synthetase
VKELLAQRTLLPAFETYADKMAFHDGDWHGSFAQHADRTLSIADAMKRQLGIEKGDRFAIMAANSHQYLELYHAAFLTGAIANPLNLRVAGKELQFILADSGTELVFVDALFAEHLGRNIAETCRSARSC